MATIPDVTDDSGTLTPWAQQFVDGYVRAKIAGDVAKQTRIRAAVAGVAKLAPIVHVLDDADADPAFAAYLAET